VGNAFDDDGSEFFGERQVVGGGQRFCAELGKAEPGDGARGPGTMSERPLTKSFVLSPVAPSVNFAKALSSASCAFLPTG
jgi:hypothetical protein